MLGFINVKQFWCEQNETRVISEINFFLTEVLQLLS